MNSVHPRVCGEHADPCFDIADAFGSSPRMRGTHRTSTGGIRLPRFIPAYAGNTLWVAQGRRLEAVHPRVCGEHLSGYQIIHHYPGSSPRMRGTHAGLAVARSLQRFIPAYAGNTRAPGGTPSRCAVHPRVCGEHVLELSCHQAVSGSSPRMRGTLLVFGAIVFRERFIPAYAGNTGY